MRNLSFHELVALINSIISKSPGGWRRDMAQDILERLKIRFTLTTRDFTNLAELSRAANITVEQIEVKASAEREELTSTLKTLEALIAELEAENAALKNRPVQTITTEVKVGLTKEELIALLMSGEGEAILSDVEAEKAKQKELEDAEALLKKFEKDIEFMKPEDTTSTGGKRRRTTKGKNGKLKKLLAKYISINPKLMKEYKELLDQCFTIHNIAGEHVIKSIFGTLKPSHAVHVSRFEAERYVRVLMTNHLNNNFCKDATRLPFDGVTPNFLTDKFNKILNGGV